MNDQSVANDEQKRIEALKLYDILDTLPEQEYDDLTRLASEICQTPIALISLVDENRQWFKSRIGIDAQETSRDISFCAHAIEADSIFEVANPTEDSRFATNPLVTGYPNIRFYAGAPLINKDGLRIGTLCVIDSVPHTINESQKNALRILARSVISLLDLRREKREVELFKKALDEVSIVSVFDAKLNYEYVNEKFCALAEMTESDILGKNTTEISIAEITPEQETEIFAQVTNGKIYKGKIKNLNKNGVVTWSNLTIIPFTNKNNELIKILSLRNDITTEVMMLERLETAEEIAKIGNWELDMVNGGRYWSRGIYTIMDYGPEDDMDIKPSLLDMVKPSEKDRLNNALQLLFQGKDIPPVSEFTITTLKKKEKDVFVAFKKRINSKGAIIAIYGTVQDVTEKNIADKLTKENLLRVQDLFNNAPCGYHSIDAEGTFIDINDTELKWLGYSREEVIGKLNIKDIIDERRDPFLGRDFGMLKQTGHLKDRQAAFKCKDGSYIDVMVSATAIYDDDEKFICTRTTLYDITELKKAQDKLEESEAKYRSLVEETSQLTYTTDVEGSFTYVSPRLKKIIGYDEHDILGKRFPFIYTDEWRKKAILFYIDQLNNKVEETNFLFPIKNAQGEKLWVEQSAILVRENDQITGFRCVLYDVTERINTEEAMAEATKLATEAKEMQQNFLGKMSHEIRTPMNGVVGMVNLLKATPLSQKQTVYVDGIKESAQNMLRIINDILDVTKIQSGKIVFEDADFDLPQLVNNVIFTLKPTADQKNILIASHIDNKIPTSLIADPVRLNQILLNLAGNAIKFTEKGSVIISIAQKSADENTTTLEFKITDTGIGIAKDKISKIFESFTQAESDTTRKYGGTGLGLTIAKQMIEQQGGEIKVNSDLGVGTTFSFTFNFKLAKDHIEPKTKEAKKYQEVSFKGYDILLVEDNVMNQQVAKFTLENWDANVTIANSGMAAIELLKTNKYDLMLMDIQMPQMSGLQATTIIRQQLHINTPIIAMTASAMHGEKDKCKAAGMNDYISKPFDPDELNKKMHSFLSKNKKSIREKAIDMSYVKQVANDDILFTKEILSIYISRTPAMLKYIDQNIAAGNFKLLYAQVHELKNSVGLLGARKLHDMLADIEDDLFNFTPQQSTIDMLKTILREDIPDSIEEAAGELELL